MGRVLTVMNVGSDFCLKKPYTCGSDKCQQAADGKNTVSGSDSFNIFISDPGECKGSVNSVCKWHCMGQ